LKDRFIFLKFKGFVAGDQEQKQTKWKLLLLFALNIEIKHSFYQSTVGSEMFIVTPKTANDAKLISTKSIREKS